VGAWEVRKTVPCGILFYKVNAASPMSNHRMHRPASIALGIGLILLLSACTGGAASRAVSAYTPVGGAKAGGDAVAPAPGVRGGRSYLFRIDRPPVSIQSPSVKLANLVANIPGLGIAGIPSTDGTAAVILVEDSPDTPWGTRLNEAEAKIFPAFDANKSMGDWLILVTDVIVRGSQDPIPYTGYRWTRKQVQTYVSCGIPATGSNDCKAAFFRAAKSVVLAAAGYVPRGK
jgi:hypothetical protein